VWLDGLSVSGRPNHSLELTGLSWSFAGLEQVAAEVGERRHRTWAALQLSFSVSTQLYLERENQNIPDFEKAMTMENTSKQITIPQYSLLKILAIWATAAIPMGFLGWVVAPAMADDPTRPGFERLAVLTIGLIWQFIMVLFLIYKENGNLRWATLKERLWLGSPRSPKTGEVSRRLWFWLIPLIVLVAIYEMQFSGYVARAWTSLFPFLAEPPGWSLDGLLNTPAGRAQMVGAWNILALFTMSAIFNTVLGEELLFRGLLLPRMNKVFGKWDWVANGLLFGFYHLHQPWGLLSIGGLIFFAFPTKQFRSAWFGIIAHSGQSIFFIFLMLGLVLGLA